MIKYIRVDTKFLFPASELQKIIKKDIREIVKRYAGFTEIISYSTGNNLADSEHTLSEIFGKPATIDEQFHWALTAVGLRRLINDLRTIEEENLDILETDIINAIKERRIGIDEFFIEGYDVKSRTFHAIVTNYFEI